MGMVAKLIIGVAATALVGLSASGANAQQNWSMATSWGGGPLMKIGAKAFGEKVKFLTDGRIEIQVFPSGQLGSGLKVSETVRNGVAEVGHTWMGYDWGKDKTTVLFGGYAGGLNAEQMIHWMYQGGGKELYREFRLEKFGIVALPCGALPAEMGLHSRKRIQTLDDFKGLKLRTAGAWADILKSLGAAPTTLAPPDSYTALERRVIDGTEFITPWTNYKLGFHKIAKYIMVPGLHSPTHANEAIFKLDLWNKLPKDLQTKITIAGELAGHRSHISLGLNDLGAMEKLRSGRNEWVEIDQSLKDKIFELGRSWSKEQAKKQTAKGNPWMARVSGSYWSFYDRFLKNGTYRHK